MRTLPLPLALAALLAPSLAAPAAAQGPCGQALQAPAVGSWVDWTAAEGTMRLAVVGAEERGGQPHRWVEMKLTGARGGMVMKFLVPRYPYDPSEVKEVIMQPDGRPPMKMPAEMLQRMGQGGGPARELLARCGRATLVGTERITVPAGSFSTEHWRDAEDGTDVWVSKQVPFGLVKAQGKDGSNSLVLAGHGTGATTAITQEPVAMPGMPTR